MQRLQERVYVSLIASPTPTHPPMATDNTRTRDTYKHRHMIAASLLGLALNRPPSPRGCLYLSRPLHAPAVGACI